MKRRTFIQSMIAGIAVPATALAQDPTPSVPEATISPEPTNPQPPAPTDGLDIASPQDIETISGISDGTRCTFDD
ncbi:MAG: hypothetical protein II767_10960 [Proteobacteria bacterium]|nr:hypothetical protein [Pseudomonadota bacterium]MBQ4360766.1 hypothetical protein [Pseudomonadota bacterium]